MDMREWEEGQRARGAHIVHEALATKDIGEEARGILDVWATLGADRLLPVLVIDTHRFCETRTSTATTQHQLWWWATRSIRGWKGAPMSLQGMWLAPKKEICPNLVVSCCSRWLKQLTAAQLGSAYPNLVEQPWAEWELSWAKLW